MTDVIFSPTFFPSKHSPSVGNQTGPCVTSIGRSRLLRLYKLPNWGRGGLCVVVHARTRASVTRGLLMLSVSRPE